MAKICSVTQVNEYLKAVFDGNPNLNGIYVKGEISNHKLHSSGHHYLTLKDDGGVLRAVMFKFDAHKLNFRPENGMKIIAKGRISVFPRDGQYQLYISDMIPDGVGALYVAFEQLKKKLEGEGLFDAIHKKPLPKYPRKIAVITSPTGAAVRDILRVLKSRFPMSDVLVCPVLVQGSDAPADICSMIEYVNEHSLADLIITGRGGGSIEDFWGFNDEGVARAIFNSDIPVISAVGHEPDVTIADFVADVRAATPSNAAEIAVPEQTALYRNVRDCEIRMLSSITSRLNVYKETIRNMAEKKVMRSPENFFQERRLTLDFLSEKLVNSTGRIISANKEIFTRLVASVDAMSPLKVISRGYSIATKDDGKIVKRVSDVSSGEKITIRVEDGNVGCIVE